ncbi:MAG: hypothetical protein QW321_02045 [Candidatus Aenigmatarchaeota archaeon]
MKEEIETLTLAEVTDFDIKYLFPSRMKLKGRRKKGWLTEERAKKIIRGKTEIAKIFHNPFTENVIKELLSYLKEDPDSPDFLENMKIKIQDLLKFYRDFNKSKRRIKERIEQLQNELETEEEAELEKEKTRLEEEKHIQEMELNIIKAMLKKIEEKMNEISRKKKELAYLQAQEQKARLIETILQLTKDINHWIKYCDHRKKKLNVEDVIKLFFDWKKESRIIKAQEETTEMIRQLKEMTKKMDKQLEELKEVKICM